MNFNRRDFVLQTPAGILGLFEALAQRAAAAPPSTVSPADQAALDYWVYGMGVPPNEILGGQEQRGANSGPSGGIQREPSFLYYDGQELVPMDQFDDTKLLDSGDTQVNFQMQRLRLNAADQAQYQRYTSGAIYFELQQHEQAAPPVPAAGDLIQLASTVFSAFSPGSGGKPKTAAKTTAKPKKAGAGAAPPAAPTPPVAGTPITLQSASDSQSLPLPQGAGKAAFTAFVKDPQSSILGTLFKILAGQENNSSPVYTQLLSIGMLAIPALATIRKVVSNLQIQGSNQAPIIQGKASDIAATRAVLSGMSSPLKLINGDYVVIPQEHGPLIQPQLKNYKTYNGFLVPKSADQLSVTEEMVQNALPGVSYLTMNIKVVKTKFTPATNIPVSS